MARQGTAAHASSRRRRRVRAQKQRGPADQDVADQEDSEEVSIRRRRSWHLFQVAEQTLAGSGRAEQSRTAVSAGAGTDVRYRRCPQVARQGLDVRWPSGNRRLLPVVAVLERGGKNPAHQGGRSWPCRQRRRQRVERAHDNLPAASLPLHGQGCAPLGQRRGSTTQRPQKSQVDGGPAGAGPSKPASTGRAIGDLRPSTTAGSKPAGNPAVAARQSMPPATTSVPPAST